MAGWRRGVHYPLDLKENSWFFKYMVFRWILGSALGSLNQVKLECVVCCFTSRNPKYSLCFFSKAVNQKQNHSFLFALAYFHTMRNKQELSF